MRTQQGDDTIFQDAAATFRSLKLGDTEPAEGEAANDDSSSSSSSNDDADVTLRMPASVVMQVRAGHCAGCCCLCSALPAGQHIIRLFAKMQKR